MAIIGMLAAIVGPSIMGKFGGAQRDTAAAQISNLGQALDSYRLDVGKYPKSMDGLLKNDSGSKRWDGPYLKKSVLPKDPWGNAYVYRRPGQHGDYDISSYAADGQAGGQEDDEDIVSWK